MLPWEKRPIEVSNLLNPAFCSVLLRGAIRAFQEEADEGMPYALSFLMLPIVLHKLTRQALPRTIRTRLHVWLQDRPEVRVDFAKRTRDLVPFTKEALIFGIGCDFFTIDESGRLVVVRRGSRRFPWASGTEPHVCYKKAEFVGRWFAQTGDPTTILTMWGIRP